MYQVRTVKTINNKQIDQMVSAIHAFLGQYTREHLNLDFGINDTDAAIGFYNFILHEASFDTEPKCSGRT